MKSSIIQSKTIILLLLLVVGFGSQVSAKNSFKAEHPAYLHALSNLRAARWMIEHRPGDWKQTQDEIIAVQQIDAAIAEIKKAAIEDGKNLQDHPAVEEKPEHIGRLRMAVDYLMKAREEINREEDNGFAQGLKARALSHINGALRATEVAVHQ